MNENVNTEGLVVEELMNKELTQGEIEVINEWLFPKEKMLQMLPDLIMFSSTAFAVRDRIGHMLKIRDRLAFPNIFIKNGQKKEYFSEIPSQERAIVEDVYKKDFPDRNFMDDYSKGEGWILKRALIEEYGVEEGDVFVSEEIETLDEFLLKNQYQFKEEVVLIMPYPFGIREEKAYLKLIGDEYYLISSAFKDEKYGDCSEENWHKSPISKSVVLAELAITKEKGF